MVPAAAVTTLPGGDTLFVRTRAGVIARAVKAGGKDGNHVLILSGVKPGEQVVTAGVFKLRNGAPVQVNNAGQPAASANPRPTNS